MTTPSDPAVLATAVHALRGWQDDSAALQLHPGDVGWFWRFGAGATAAAIRTWGVDGRIAAVGLLDGPDMLRLTCAPDVLHDRAFADDVAADICDAGRGVLPAGAVSVEAPTGAAVHDALAGWGWAVGEAWTPLRRDLTDPVDDPGVRIEVVGPDRPDLVSDHVAVLRAAFERSTFTDERWHTMASGLPFADGRSLVAYDGADAVATVTVWSAGPGRPGLIEPLGVHRDHRGHGHGTAITLAAAAALRELGCPSALVCTPSSNTGGVATYRAGGFEALPERFDSTRAG